MSSLLKKFSKEMIPAVEREMMSVLNVSEGKPDLYHGMMHYHMGWIDKDFVPTSGKGGKRIRPLLCMLVCSAAGGNWEDAIPAGAAIEILHNFTLVHDDIQDDSPTRRGQATVWKNWGMPQAINVGDALFASSYVALTRLADRGVPAGKLIHAVNSLTNTCLKLTSGQHHDMRFETMDSVTVNEYVFMIGGKTAALLALCGELGALVAGCDEQTITHYTELARDLGLAFQVKDDILGIWGDEEAIGKSAATDIATRKKSLPVLYGLEKSSALRELYAQPENNDTFVSDAIALLDDCGARDYARERATYYSNSALAHWEAAQPTGPAAQALQELTDMLLNRQA